MKILHINDQAGVACVLAKYQRLTGADSKVISYNKFDKFGIFKFYKAYSELVDRDFFICCCISEAKNADIIHIHSMEELVIKMRKTFGNSKKIILHYHGTDLRGRKVPNHSIIKKLNSKLNFFIARSKHRLRLIQRGYYKSLSSLKIEAQNLADELLVATPDLLELLPNAKYLPNPVDVEHFSNEKIENNKSTNSALTIKTETGNIEKTLKYCKENNIDLKIDVFDRTTNPIQYKDIPSLLKKYDVYVDIKIVDDQLLQSLSKTGLESLACGLKVLNYELDYLDTLPEKHNPINVVNQLQKIYT